MIFLADMLDRARTSNYSSDLETSAEANLRKRVSRWTMMEESPGDQLLWKMELYTLDSGLTELEMDLARKCGQTAQSTKVNGKTIKPTVKAN